MAYTPKEIEFLKKMKAQGVSQEEAFKRLRAVQQPKEQGMLSKLYQNTIGKTTAAAEIGGVLLGAEKLVSGAGKLAMEGVGQLTRLAHGDQSADPNSFYNVNKVTSENLRNTWDTNTANFLNKATGGAMKEYPLLSFSGEQAAPFFAGYGAEKLIADVGIKALSYTPQISKFITSVAEKTPALAKYGSALQTSSKLLAGNAAYNIASEGELPGVVSNALALAIPVGGKYILGKIGEGLVKSKTVKSIAENLTLSNFTDKTGLRNILAKVANNGGDIVGIPENELNQMAMQAHTSLGGKGGNVGDDLMGGVVKKIQENIKPGSVPEQIAQMNKIGDDLSKSVSDDLANIPHAVPSVPAKRILQTVEDKGIKVNKPVDLSKFKDVNGNWKEIYTPSELNEIKKLSDDTFKNMYSSEGTAKEAYLGMANDRNAVKKQIEDIAAENGIPDIASRNAEVALFKGLAESGRDASIGKRLATTFKRNPLIASLGAIGGVGGLIGGSYVVSKQTGLPQWATGLAAFTIGVMLTHRFGDNAWTTKQAARLFNIVGQKGISTLNKYLETGKDVYRASAQKTADKITNEMLKLSPPSGKPITSFPADFSPATESKFAAANRGASIANAGSYQGKPNTSTKIPKLADEFKKFIETTAQRSGRDVSKYEKKLLSILKGRVTGTDIEKKRLIEQAQKTAKQMLDFFEKNKLYNRYE